MSVSVLMQVLLVGLVATAVGDIWQWGFGRALGKKVVDWRPVGRWVVGFKSGRFWHQNFEDMPSVAHESQWGWATHYVVGLAYAVLYGLILWLCQVPSSWGLALLFGLLTTLAPFCLMKPAMGLGFWGCKLPNVALGVTVTISTHLAFGVGLHLGALLSGL